MPYVRQLPSMSRLALAGVILLASASGSAQACVACFEEDGDDSLRWNASTGQDMLNFPPDRVVDFEHMRRELDIPDMNTPILTCKATLTFTIDEGPRYRVNTVTFKGNTIFSGEELAGRLPEGVEVKSVTVWESDRCAATYVHG